MNNVRQPSEVSRVLFDILAYLTNHPDADDTIDGIAHWWLLEQKIREQIPIVEKALAELIKKGFVLALDGSNGRTRYRINRYKQRKISVFLGRKKVGPNGKSDIEHL